MQEMTNLKGIPDIMVQVLKPNDHDMGDAKYSITQLIKPPRLLKLQRAHEHEVQLDAMDVWSSFIGSSVHGGIYDKLKSNTEYLLEHKLSDAVTGPNGVVNISGTFDAFHIPTSTLYDHKIITTIQFGLEVKPEYEAQLNMYAHILRKQGYEVNNLMLNVVYLDWRKAAFMKAEAGKYPEAPTRTIPVNVWPDNQAEQFYMERIKLHEEADKIEDENNLPLCLAEEMWERPAKYALYRNGGLKAAKLGDSEQELHEYAKWKGIKPGSYYIELRPATRVRCEGYCSVAPFCNQYQDYLKNINGDLNV
jgi:hypothetical protein